VSGAAAAAIGESGSEELRDRALALLLGLLLLLEGDLLGRQLLVLLLALLERLDLAAVCAGGVCREVRVEDPFSRCRAKSKNRP
jgi:hypothetical protein